MSQNSHAHLVVVTLAAEECQDVLRLAERTYAGDPSAQQLLLRLQDGASLAVWLREQVRLELSLTDAAILKELRYLARRSNHAGAVTDELALA